jgi:hypothetical protein
MGRASRRGARFLIAQRSQRRSELLCGDRETVSFGYPYRFRDR